MIVCSVLRRPVCLPVSTTPWPANHCHLRRPCLSTCVYSTPTSEPHCPLRRPFLSTWVYCPLTSESLSSNTSLSVYLGLLPPDQRTIVLYDVPFCLPGSIAPWPVNHCPLRRPCLSTWIYPPDQRTIVLYDVPVCLPVYPPWPANHCPLRRPCLSTCLSPLTSEPLSPSDTTRCMWHQRCDN
jgi:hypothetical protein